MRSTTGFHVVLEGARLPGVTGHRGRTGLLPLDELGRDAAWESEPYPQTLQEWSKAFLSKTWRAPMVLPSPMELREVHEEIVSVTVVLFGATGILFIAMIPLLMMAWGLLDHPGVHQAHLNQVLKHFTDLLSPLETLLRPLLRLALLACAAVGLGAGDGEEELLTRSDAIGRAKRLLISLILLNLCLSILLLSSLSAASALLRMTEQRNYEQLQVKLRGLENTVEDLVQQASSNLRKELRSVEERLKRQIESSQKDQDGSGGSADAAETFNVKRGLSEQFTGEVRAAEDRLTRRMDSERRDHKEAVAELRREVTAQLLAQQQQDTASFATQRVVPKESEELSKLRGVMEDLRSLQEHAQKDGDRRQHGEDATRLAQELKDQKQLCERMDLSMRQHMSKYQTEMLTVRTSVEKVDLAAKQAQKAAETRGASAEQEQERENAFVGCVSDLDAELRRDMRQMVTKVQSDMLSEFKTLLSATQEERHRVGRYHPAP
eukprot:g24439.t2